MVNESNKIICDICNSSQNKIIYNGPIRDGAFGSIIAKSKIYQCDGCGVARLDERDCFKQKNYESRGRYYSVLMLSSILNPIGKENFIYISSYTLKYKFRIMNC